MTRTITKLLLRQQLLEAGVRRPVIYPAGGRFTQTLCLCLCFSVIPSFFMIIFASPLCVKIPSQQYCDYKSQISFFFPLFFFSSCRDLNSALLHVSLSCLNFDFSPPHTDNNARKKIREASCKCDSSVVISTCNRCI